MESFLISIASFIAKIISSGGYFGITALMAIESSFMPFPSEIVIPPAAYLAQQGQFNIFLVILAGIIGSLIGALINYYLALTLGRKAIYYLANKRFARYFLISEEKIIKAEDSFLKYGSSSTFFGRLVPAVRQLISIPAGFAKMRLSVFVFYTILGSSIWISILAFLGYWFGSNQEILEKYYQEISTFFIALAAILIISVIIKKRIKKNG